MRASNGFTLVETLLTIVIVGIIAGVSAKILMSGIDTYSFVSNRKDASQHARVAMNRMISELTSVENGDITGIYNNRVLFRDKDNISTSFRSTTMNGQPVIKRGDDFLAGRLGLLDFDYLKADGTNAATPAETKRINIELTIDSLGGFGPVPLRAEIFPRNLMYENFR